MSISNITDVCITTDCHVFFLFCFQKYILYLLRDIASELGWDETKSDPHLTRQVLSLAKLSLAILRAIMY